MKPSQLTATNIDVGDFKLTKAPKARQAPAAVVAAAITDIVDPIKGKLPKIEKNPITPPMVQTVDNPKLAVPAAINVQKNIQSA